MERQKIEETLMKMINKAPERTDCTADMDLVDEIGFSSIEVMELIACAEETFGVKLNSRDFRTVATPEDLADVIEKKM